MITPLPGRGIEITLDRARILRLDFNALCALNKATGENPLDGKFWEGFDNPVKLRATLWAALIHEDAKLSIEQVGAMMEVSQVGEIAQALAAAVNAAMPAPKKTEDAAA